MTFRKAFVAYWNGNKPWYQIMLGFVTLFTGLLVLATAPLAIWILMGAIYIAITLGTISNVKTLRRVLTQREKIQNNKS